MAHSPTMRDVLINITRPQSLLGIALLNDALLHPHGTIAGPIQSGYIRPWRHIPGHKSGTSSLQLDKDGFKVNLDLQQFKPEEITVKTKEGYVTVEGNHEERADDHGFVSRQFKRRYVLPKEIEHEHITSTLSSDGVLTIQAPKKTLAALDGKVRVIPVVLAEPPAIKQAASSSMAQSMES